MRTAAILLELAKEFKLTAVSDPLERWISIRVHGHKAISNKDQWYTISIDGTIVSISKVVLVTNSGGGSAFMNHTRTELMLVDLADPNSIDVIRNWLEQL